MGRHTRPNDTADSGRPSTPPERPDGRVRYWWTVPERPGTGGDMLKFAGAWFLIAVLMIIAIGLLG